MILIPFYLQQDQVWGDRDLEHLDPDHRANLIPFLRGNARTLYGLAHDQIVDATTAEDWLEQTPLMRRLTQMEADRPIEARRATAERNRDYEMETGYEKVRLG